MNTPIDRFATLLISFGLIGLVMGAIVLLGYISYRQRNPMITEDDGTERDEF